MSEEPKVVWAQDAFYRSQVISDAEVAWKILRDADENGLRIPTSQALNEAHEILKKLKPPTSALMERSGWGGDRHHALVRYAYSRATHRWDARKVWVDLELPVVPDERRKPPTSPHLTLSSWGRLPRPDIFFEATDESRVWIECQTQLSWRGLSEKAKAARLFGEQNAYTDFVIVGVSTDDRYLEEVRQAVLSCGRRFEHWDPIKQPIAEIGEDANALIQQEVQPPPPTRGPHSGSERFWAWRGGSNRQPAVIVEDVPLTLPLTSGGGRAFVTGSWPRDCPDCKGSGSSPNGVRETCWRCSGNGLVAAGSRDWKLCPRCWAAQTLPTDPCERCQGRGWTMAESAVGTSIGIPKPTEPIEFRENVVNLYPDSLKSRKLTLRIHIAFEARATDGRVGTSETPQ
jgi:hypothetical protein